MNGSDFRTAADGTAEWDQVNIITALDAPAYDTYTSETVHFDAYADGGVSGLEGIYYQIVDKKAGFDKEVGVENFIIKNIGNAFVIELFVRSEE